jgi:hypothetical protein
MGKEKARRTGVRRAFSVADDLLKGQAMGD